MSDNLPVAWAERWTPWRRWMRRFQLGRLVIRVTDEDGTQKIVEQKLETVQTDRGPWTRLAPAPKGEFMGVMYENPTLPKLPANLARLDLPGATGDFDSVAPWAGPLERAWISGFDGKIVEFVDRQRFPASAQKEMHEGGQAFAKTKAGQAYKTYLTQCREILRKAGWSEEEIP